MRLASHLNDTAMGRMYEVLGTGKTELEMVDVLRKAYRDLGCDQFSFEPIIAYGAHASDPHHQNRDSKPVRGDSIVVDMGCIKDGYCSDMTRTFFYGEPSERGREVYETVLAANLNAIATVRPGISHAEVDAAARSVIEAAGYGPYFTHRLGHGIGLECHEGGDVSQGNTDLIEVGEIFSIEPGIYLPGELGVRIEDLVLVTEDGCELLNKYPKDLMIVEATD